MAETDFNIADFLGACGGSVATWDTTTNTTTTSTDVDTSSTTRVPSPTIDLIRSAEGVSADVRRGNFLYLGPDGILRVWGGPEQGTLVGLAVDVSPTDAVVMPTFSTGMGDLNVRYVKPLQRVISSSSSSSSSSRSYHNSSSSGIVIYKSMQELREGVMAALFGARPLSACSEKHLQTTLFAAAQAIEEIKREIMSRQSPSEGYETRFELMEIEEG
jgi:hypothetical protein